MNVEGFPLSPQQRHLWALTREQTGGSPYWARCVVRIRGPLDRQALRGVLDGLPARYEILRTTFFVSEELSAPLQVIEPAGDTSEGFRFEDLGASDPAGQRKAIESIEQAVGSTAALDRTSPAFFTLISLSPSEHVLIIGVSALRCDTISLNRLAADIANQYAAASTATSRTDDVLQYADVAISLNEILESPDAEAGLRFWESQDLVEPLSARLPFERRTGVDTAFAPARVPVRLADGSPAAARACAAASGVAPDIVALACWQVLLQRTLGTDKVAIGVVADGRSYAELEQAIGLFARTLPLSGELPEDLSFAEVMKRLDEAVRAAGSWAECFDARRLPAARDGGAAFVRLPFERVEQRKPFDANGVTFDVERADARTDRFVMKLSARINGSGPWDLSLEYDSSRCTAGDAQRIAAQYACLFASALSDPGRAIGKLNLLPSDQQAELLSLAGSRVAAAAPVALVHHRFESQAVRVAASRAVVCEDASLTYAELNGRANRLAHYLRAHGVGPEVLVGLCLDRSVDVAVGILGILKAGGAYVPLDPHLPPARLATLIDESRAIVVVSREALTDRLPESARLVLLDRDQDAIAASPAVNPSGGAAPEHIAYVLFTSGSTGKPKGVAIEHRQLARYVDAVSRRLDLPAAASYATVTTFAADLGNTAIFPALAGGGCLHIVTEERASDPAAFADYVDRHAIDVLKIVPSHLKALLSSSQPERVLPKQRLILGGEACPWDLVEQVQTLAPGCVVVNHYGPTEATIGATVFRATRHDERPPSATVPIGRPLDHALVYVVDRHRQLVPLWMAGELCIGGAGVARGYLATPDPAHDPFVPDPWSPPGVRMYRTGDRVRMLPGGLLEFLGRLDSQIKIRGFRVEVGEVDSALRRHPRVKDLAVLAHDDGSGMRLAAFLVGSGTPALQAGELKTFLFEQGLPDYMIPASFVVLDALPLTANGKLDRQGLLASLDAVSTADAGDEPLTEWESLVAGIWSELLGVGDIQSRDNFYDLGGHSLLAIQVVTALEKRARVHISPRDLVFHTLRQFAALCESKSPHAPASAS